MRLSLSLAVLLLSMAASAAETPAPEPKPALRSGLVLGVSAGGTGGTASGYPNNVNLIDKPEFFVDGGFLAGGTGSIFVMGALADEVNVGVNLAQSNMTSSSYQSSATGYGFRLEVFPFPKLVHSLRNLAISAQFGFGTANLVPKDHTRPAAETQQTFLAGGAFWEFAFGKVLGGHFAAAPNLELMYFGSRSYDRVGVTLGLRFVFYGGP